MRIAIVASAALVNLWIGAATMAADDVSSMQVMSGMPNMGKGQWTINVLEGGGGMPRTASVCFDSLAQMARGPEIPGRKPGMQGRQQSECTSRVIENTSARGVVESTCPNGATRTTITRDGAKAFLMHAERSGTGEPASMKARYAYDGPCKAGSPAATMDKDSEQCRKMRAMASMDPAQMCASAGARRQMCEDQMRSSLAQMQAMCQ
jgi:hypothetical protein